MRTLAGWITAAIILTAGILYFFFGTEETLVPPLHLVGDIETCLDTQSLSDLGTVTSVKLEGENYNAVSIEEIAEKQKVCGKLESILFVAEDGFTAEIGGKTVKDSYLSFTPENGWCAINPKHPNSANAKFLQQIIFVSTPEENHQTSIRLINGDEQRTETVGSLYAGQTILYPYPEGSAEKNDYTATVSTKRTCVTGAILGFQDAEQLKLTFESGDTFSIRSSSGFFQLNGNHLDYINAFTRQKDSNIRAIKAE